MVELTNLQPGANLTLPATVDVLAVDVRWNAGAQTAFAERIGVAALPYVRGRIPGRDHLVFSNQPATPDRGTRLAVQDGILEVEFARVPTDVERITIVSYIAPRPNAPRRTLGELDELSILLREGSTSTTIAASQSLHAYLGSAVAAAICDVVRTTSGWDVVVQARGYDAGLEAVAAQAGLKI